MQAIKGTLLIRSISGEEIQVVVERNGKLIEYHTRQKGQSIVGNIYLASIKAIKKSINAAIVMLDENTTGFLSLSDVHSSYYGPNKQLKLKQLLIVQISRDASGAKLANCTTNIALTGVHCIFSPFTARASGISKNIKGESRIRIKEFLQKLNPDASLIMRTASSYASMQEIQSDYQRLQSLWRTIRQKAKLEKIGFLHGDDLLLQVLRQYSEHSIESVVVSNKELYDRIQRYLARKLLAPPHVSYANYDIFSNIQEQVNDLFKHELTLPSGGSIIFGYTQACITIDVNSKRSVREKNIANTAFKTNMEAAEVVCEQIMLRNLGGIIIIDFIDMENEEHIDTLNAMVKEKFKIDKAAIRIVNYGPLGVVQISRQRLGPSVVDKYYESCAHCNAVGYIITNRSVILSLLEQIHYLRAMKIYTSAEIMTELLNNFSQELKDKRIQWELVDEKNELFNKVEEVEALQKQII